MVYLNEEDDEDRFEQLAADLWFRAFDAPGLRERLRVNWYCFRRWLDDLTRGIVSPLAFRRAAALAEAKYTFGLLEGETGNPLISDFTLAAEAAADRPMDPDDDDFEISDAELLAKRIEWTVWCIEGERKQMLRFKRELSIRTRADYARRIAYGERSLASLRAYGTLGEA